MKGRTGITTLIRAILLAGLVPGFAPGASAAEAAGGAPPASPAAQKLPEEELGEVLVSGIRTKPSRNMQNIVDWLKRLVGQFRYEGYVELKPGPGIPPGRLLVRGGGDCVAFGLAPGVQCTINVRWPQVRGENGAQVLGGSSSLNPAMIVYGLDPDHRAIHYLQVDKNGIADGGLGYLVGDTLTTTAPCEDIPGDCQRITKIKAQPDGKLIQMQIDINQDGERAVRYTFLMRRVSQAQASEASKAP